MRGRYSYRIQMRGRDGRWNAGIAREDSFVRDPRAIARSLLERWVIDHPGRAKGGLRILATDAIDEPEYFHAAVRVQVFRGSLREHPRGPAAAAYLGYDVEEPGGPSTWSWWRRRASHESEEDAYVEAA